MDSLRSRPSQAPRKALQKAPSKLSKPTARPKATRVDDKIKKRMSMRYAEISSPLDAGMGIPAMPSLMGAYSDARQDADEDRTIKPDDAKVAAEDKKTLSADDFDPDAFLKTKLANSTEAELRSLQSALHNAKNDTAAELQRSVFKNYAEFVLISKEISVLENEMLELKDLISDYKSMPSMLNIPDPTSLTSATLSTYKRSSVADLRVLYFNQMQTLHSTIEGAAKFVPVTPGRHVVGEFENVLGLNAATYRIMHKVKFVVLDDAVLVAKRRRRNAGGGTTDGSGSTVNEGKLVAEKCWPLSEMVVLDTKDSPNMTNVFKVRHGKETHVYRTEAPYEKKQILALFRQVAEELQQKKRKEREGEHERRKSMWQQNSGGGRGSPAPPMPVPDWLSELAKKGGEIPGMADDAKSKAERDARFVSDWSDDLTVAIALKEWKKAVQLVEDGQAKSSTIPALSAKLPTLTAQLTSSLLDALALPSNRKSNVVTIITLLNRLKAGSAARNTFLDMRTKVVQGLMRKIPFEGHAGAYIGELSVVFFTCIKHTADWYLAAFRENEVASSFIAWAKQQIETYSSIFRKQVYSADAEPKVIDEAIQITHIQSKKLLEEYGLDFKYLLNQLLVPNPNSISSAGDAAPKFRVNEHRQSKQIVMAVKAGMPGLRTKTSVTHLQQAPPPPTLSAPPVSRRRTPGPPEPSGSSSQSNLPPPIPGTSSSTSYLGGRRTPVSARGPPPPSSAGLESPTPSRERSSSTLNADSNPRSYLGGNRTPVSGRPPPPSSPALGSRDLSSSTSSNPADNRDRSDSRVGGGGYYGSGRSTPTAGDRERPPRGVPLGGAAGGGGIQRTQSPAPPPPRSANRPPSSAGVQTPVRPPRQGMF